jgi:hypothetical protein
LAQALLGWFLVPVIWRACGRPGGRRTERRELVALMSNSFALASKSLPR